MRSTILIWGAGLAVAALAAGISLSPADTRIADGVHVAGIHLGGMTPVEAEAAIKERAEAFEQATVTLRVHYPGDGASHTHTWSRKELGVHVNIGGTLARARAIGEGQSVILREVLSLLQPLEHTDVGLDRRLDLATINAVVKTLQQQHQRPATNARVQTHANGFTVTPERNGYRLPDDTAQILSQLARGGASDADIRMEVQRPTVTAASLKQANTVLATSVTKYSERQVDRTYNVRFGARMIDGVVVPPGEVFSMNAITGPRSSSRGFRKAPIFVKGELVDGDGGGICQVSSTVYNAALKGGLPIVRRAHHSSPVPYVPVGLDATVAFGSLDFQFRNNTSAPIVVVAQTPPGRLVITLYGIASARQEVRIVQTDLSYQPTTEVRVNDPTLPKGVTKVEDKGSRGARVTTWRHFLQNGEVIRRELVSRDVYRPRARKVLVGTGAAQPPQPPPAETQQTAHTPYQGTSAN